MSLIRKRSTIFETRLMWPATPAIHCMLVLLLDTLNILARVIILRPYSLLSARCWLVSDLRGISNISLAQLLIRNPCLSLAFLNILKSNFTQRVALAIDLSSLEIVHIIIVVVVVIVTHFNICKEEKSKTYKYLGNFQAVTVAQAGCLGG